MNEIYEKTKAAFDAARERRAKANEAFEAADKEMKASKDAFDKAFWEFAEVKLGRVPASYKNEEKT